MSTNTSKPLDQDEVDLKTISSGINNFFETLSNGFFRLMQFVVRKIVWVIAIVIIGFGIGYFLDSFKTYDHQLIVRPNFGSIDYLYSKVDLLSSKIKDRDTAFLKSLGIKEPRRVTGIKIKPIVDVYNFVSRSEFNFKTLELLAEDGDLNTIVEDNTTAKNYSFHMIKLTTSGETSQKATIEPIMNFLNTSDYYSKIQKESLNNVLSKIQTNEKLIAQIDAILESIPKGSAPGPGGTVVNSDSQLNDVIRTKDLLIEEQGMFRIELVSLDKIVKLGNSALNIERSTGTEGKKKYLVPMVLLLVAGIGYGLFGFYKRKSAEQIS